MSVVAPPPSPQRPDDLEALIREARARQKRRWLGVAAIVAVLAGAALGLDSIVTKGRPGASAGGGGPNPAVRSGGACGVRIDNMRIVDSGGNTLYREPGDWTPSYPHPSVVRCSGASVWVVWDNGGAMNQEGYVGVRSADAGRTWHLVFADSFFGVDAPHQIGPDLGPWSLGGPQAAYFTSWCPVCSPDMPKAFALWVTKDGGRTFRMYDIRGLGEYEPVGLRVAGRTATITAKGFIRGTQRRRTVTIHIA